LTAAVKACADQTHIADKISAVKRKGKSPHFSKQQGTNKYELALSEAGPSNTKRNRKNCAHRGKKPQGDQSHHSYLASWLEMNVEATAMQQWAAEHPSIAQSGTLVGYPSRAIPSQTIASFFTQGITYVSKPKHSHVQTFTGQPSELGPATLPEARILAEHLRMSKTSENLKALEALCKHQKFVEKSTPYHDVLAVEQPILTPSTSCVEEVPDAQDNRPKKTTIFKVILFGSQR
jgi:hypothetical protein